MGTTDDAAAPEGFGAGWVDGAGDALSAEGLQASAARNSGAQGRGQRGSVGSTYALYYDPERWEHGGWRSALRFHAVRLVPQGVEIHGEARAARDRVDDAIRGADGLHVAPIGAQLEDFQAAQRGIDDPVEPDAEGGVLVRFLDPVTTARA